MWKCFIFQWVHGTAEHEGIWGEGLRNREAKLAPGNQSMVFSSLGNISSYESAYFHFYGCTIVGGGPWGNIGDIWGQRLKECQFLEIFPKQNVLSWRAGPGDQLHRRPDPLRPCHRARQEGGCQGDHRSIMMTMSKVRSRGRASRFSRTFKNSSFFFFAVSPSLIFF